MLFLPLTFVFLSAYSVVHAGSANNGDNCTIADNRLQTGTYQFFSDCNSVTFCSSVTNTCQLKGCRKDDFPFGYNATSELPPKCPLGQFCPDEGDVCQDLLLVGSPCQLNRDDECQAPPNFKELADTSNRGLNVNGSVCLNNICYWANQTAGNTCHVENTAYIGYGPNGEEFIDIVSRGDCQLGFYCDSVTTTCLANKLLGDACDADKECDSQNCLSTGTCGVSADSPRHFGTGVYVAVAVAIFGGMIGTLVGLYFIHRRHRDQQREKRAQYWREQNAFHQNLLQMRDTARASLLSLPGHQSNRSDGGMSDESHAPILQHAASTPKSSGLRYTSDDSSDIDEGIMMQPQMRADGRF